MAKQEKSRSTAKHNELPGVILQNKEKQTPSVQIL